MPCFLASACSSVRDKASSPSRLARILNEVNWKRPPCFLLGQVHEVRLPSFEVQKILGVVERNDVVCVMNNESKIVMKYKLPNTVYVVAMVLDFGALVFCGFSKDGRTDR